MCVSLQNLQKVGSKRRNESDINVPVILPNKVAKKEGTEVWNKPSLVILFFEYFLVLQNFASGFNGMGGSSRFLIPVSSIHILTIGRRVGVSMTVHLALTMGRNNDLRLQLKGLSLHHVPFNIHDRARQKLYTNHSQF